MLMKSLLATALLLASAASAPACECGSRPRGSEAFKQASVVAEGRLVAIRRTVVPRSEIPEYSESVFPLFPVNRFDFELKRVWKGKTGPTVSFFGLGCCVCEYQPFEVEQTYLLYLSGHTVLRPRLMASICFPNGPIEASAEELQALGPASETYGEIPSRRPTSQVVRDGLARLVAASLDLTSGWANHRPHASAAELLAVWLLILAATPVALSLCGWFVWRKLRRRTRRWHASTNGNPKVGS